MSIYVKLYGGLGNQLFQYATGKFLSIKTNKKLIIDTAWYQTLQKETTPRDIQITNLKINADFTNSGGNHKQFFKKNLLNIFNTKTYYSEKKPFIFDQTITNINSDCYLDGYWQSYKYFNPIHDQLKNEFHPINIDSFYLPLLDKLQQKNNSVMIHIRRGDYLTSSSASKIHGVLPLTYYKNAIKFIQNRLENPHFFIFSDDIDWCINSLPTDIQKTFVLNSKKPDDVTQELFLMTKCQHQIIANSSLSWWGAWLNDNNNKTIIGPQKWLLGENSAQKSFPDLMPNNWILIEP